jgi:hypothetical protein
LFAVTVCSAAGSFFEQSQQPGWDTHECDVVPLLVAVCHF